MRCGQFMFEVRILNPNRNRKGPLNKVWNKQSAATCYLLCSNLSSFVISISFSGKVGEANKMLVTLAQKKIIIRDESMVVGSKQAITARLNWRFCDKGIKQILNHAIIKQKVPITVIGVFSVMTVGKRFSTLDPFGLLADSVSKFGSQLI